LVIADQKEPAPFSVANKTCNKYLSLNLTPGSHASTLRAEIPAATIMYSNDKHPAVLVLGQGLHVIQHLYDLKRKSASN